MISNGIITTILTAIDKDPSFKLSELNIDRDTFNLALEMISDEGYAKGIKITCDGVGKVYVPLYSTARITKKGRDFLMENDNMVKGSNAYQKLTTEAMKGKSIVRYTIFVSSTYEDLKEERQALAGPLLTKGFIPVGMELFHSAPVSQWDVITQMIDECDYYLLVIGGCYGSIDEEEGISYTEKEYNYACEHGIPVIAFLPKNPDNITAGKMDKEDREKKQELLLKFKERIKNDKKTVSFYEGIDGLKVEVLSSLDNLVKYTPRPGWMRTDVVKEVINEQVAEAKKSSEADISELKNMLSGFGEKLEEIEKKQVIFEPISYEEIDALFERHEDKIVEKAAEKAAPKWEEF